MRKDCRKLRNKNIYRFLLIIGLFCNYAVAAQAGFVHIQSENGQPFYVQWNGYTYSSSGSGYMIIPKMPLGDQIMVIGSGKDRSTEYVFRYAVSDRPRGFSLKLNIDNSLSLFDMVSFTLIKGKAVTPAEKEDIRKEADSLIQANNPSDPKDNLYKLVEINNPGIYKIFDRTTEEGTDLVYVVTNDGITDTIVIFIPAGPLTPQKPPVVTGGLNAVPGQRELPVTATTSLLATRISGRRLNTSSN